MKNIGFTVGQNFLIAEDSAMPNKHLAIHPVIYFASLMFVPQAETL